MHYRIRVKGHLDFSWQLSFVQMQITHEATGTTVLSGPLPDQAALYGMLLKINRLGLTLLALEFLVGAAGMSVRIITSIRADTNPPPFTGALPTPPAPNRPTPTHKAGYRPVFRAAALRRRGLLVHFGSSS